MFLSSIHSTLPFSLCQVPIPTGQCPGYPGMDQITALTLGSYQACEESEGKSCGEEGLTPLLLFGNLFLSYKMDLFWGFQWQKEPSASALPS